MTNTNIEVARPLSPAEVNWKTAQKIANTTFVPTAFRGKPESVFAAILYGAELGIGPMQSLNCIHVIEGRPSMAPELMRALVAKAGHRIDVKVSSNDKVVLWGKRADNDSEATVEWSMRDAQMAGLAGRGAWKTYPRAMLLARATSELCRMIFADVVAGLSYTPEEAASIAGVEWSQPAHVEPAPELAASTATEPAPVEPDWEEHSVNEPTETWENAFPNAEIVDAVIVEPDRQPTNFATTKQLGMARGLLREWGVSSTDALSLAAMHLGQEFPSLDLLSKMEISSFIKYLQDNHPGGVS